MPRRPPLRSAATLGVAALAAGCLLLGGCGGGSTTVTDPDLPTKPATFDALAEPTRVPALARAELGEQVTVRRVSLTSNGFSMEVRDRRKPENIDRYSYYNGQWDSQPVSVSVSDIESFDATTFGIGSVNWAAIPELERRALAGLDLEDESITAVSLDRIEGEQPRIYIGVNGSRGSGSLIAAADGSHVVIRRN